MSEKFSNAHLERMLIGSNAPKSRPTHLGIAKSKGGRAHHANGGNVRSAHKEGGEAREKKGFGGAILGNLASPLLNKIPYVGGLLGGLSSGLGHMLPFKEGGDVQGRKKGGRTRRCHEDGGDVGMKKRGGRAKRGAGGSLLSALAGMLPFKEGGDVETHKGGGRTRKKAAFGGLQGVMGRPMIRRMGGSPNSIEAQKLSSMSRPSPALRAITPKIMPNDEMTALAKGGRTRKPRAMGGVGKVRKDQY